VQRYQSNKSEEEQVLRADIVRLATKYGRYGYRRITALLKAEGWVVNHKRVERIWREEGLKVPIKQPKRGRLYLNDGSCIRLCPCFKNNVWSYDFVSDRLHNGKRIRMLTVIDEYTRKCLAIRVGFSLKSDDVLDTLSTLFITEGVPEYILHTFR
jgi:transposase InsO family protein